MDTYEIKLTLTRPLSLLEENNPAISPDSELPLVTSNFLENKFRRAPRKKSWVLQLKVEHVSQEELNKLQAVIADHYQYQITLALADIKEHRRKTVIAFIYGGLFLAACLGLHHLLATILGETFPRILDEGLIIIAWVAMWRPAEFLTYDWIPLRQRLNLARKLSGLSLQLS